MSQNNARKTKGDCQVCTESRDVMLTQLNNIWMCAKCLADDLATIEERSKIAAKFVENSRHSDAAIELKQDLFNAGTKSFVEIQAAVEANTEIPSDKKNHVVLDEVDTRIKALDRVIFAKEADLHAIKNERFALLVNAKQIAATLDEVTRKKYQQYDANYKPNVKSTKPKPVKSPKQEYNKAALYAAAKKYNIPAVQIQGTARAKNMSAEDAGKYLAGLMGLL